MLILTNVEMFVKQYTEQIRLTADTLTSDIDISSEQRASNFS